MPRAKAKDHQPQIKNHDYYHDNFNIWNNPHQASKKGYQFYYKNKLDHQPEIEQRLLEQQKLERQQQTLKMEEQLKEREQALIRLHNRKTERMSLENNDQAAIQVLQTKSQNYANATLTGRAQHSWNKLNQFSSKYLKMFLTPTVKQLEENGINSIHHKIQEDLQMQDMVEQSKREQVESIREIFQNQRNQHRVFQGVKPPIIKIQHQRNSSKTKTEVSQDKQFLFMGSIESKISKVEESKKPQTSSTTQRTFISKFVDTEGKPIESASNRQVSDRIVSLASSKSNNFFSPRDPLDRSEFRGLIQIDFNNKALRPQSNMLNRGFTPSYLFKKNAQEREKTKSVYSLDAQTEINSLDNFESKFLQNRKKAQRVGFPKVALYELNQP